MVRRVSSADSGGQAGGQADGAAAPNLAPVSEGGSPLNLRQGADAISGLNLFGDEDDQTAGGAGDEDNQQTSNTGNDDQAQGDDQAGNQDEPTGNDDQAGSDDDQGKSADQDGDDQEGAADAGDGDNQAPIETLAQLSEALEANPEFLAQLTDTFTADGEEVTVSLEELRRGYQRDANYRRQTQELSQARQDYEREHNTAMQNVQRELVQIGQVLMQGEQLLLGEVNTPEMTALRTSNPAEWAARREEIGQRINAIRQLYANASQQYEAYQAQQTQELQTQLKELRRREMDNLRTAIPEWGEKLKTDLLSYLGDSFGYGSDDLKNVFDSRLIVLANKARLYDEMQAVGAKTKQKVVNLPKVQTPGKGGKSGPSKEAVNISKAKQRLKKSGKLRDAADLIGLSLKDI